MSQPGRAPNVLALPLRRARELLTAAGWQVEQLLITQDRPTSGETETGSAPSDREEWRVIRQRTLGPGQAELLIAPEMRPTA